jgi:hypothetical protein
VCREESVAKLGAFEGRITIVPGAVNDPEVIKRAVARCGGVLVVLVPRLPNAIGARAPRERMNSAVGSARECFPTS